MAAAHTDSESPSRTALADRLSAVLPKGYRFGVYHLSTPPTRTRALCSAPPNEREDRTFCENHFLALSIDSKSTPADRSRGTLGNPRDQVLVFALEVFIFTTAFSSTLFVSKADSTGYLHLLGLPKGTPSPIREVATAFVAYLVEQRRRKGVQSIVSLFARAQSQYLFPGSVNNKDKHVLDDRGLVKWWCRVLNPLVENPPLGAGPPWLRAKAYLVVPGLDTTETRAFLPRTPAVQANWALGHPLHLISHYTREYDWVPARCLVPRYPDDPKSRFRDDLDEEAAKSLVLQATGSWKSVATLDVFWELMAFRQECSSGRLTGFLWLVYDSEDDDLQTTATTSLGALITPSHSFSEQPPIESPSTPTRPQEKRVGTPFSTPRKLSAAAASAVMTPPKGKGDGKSSRMENSKPKKGESVLRGRIKPRRPRVKTHQRNYLLDRPISTAYYYWPEEGRGQRVVDENDYKRAVELLLRLDFANLDLATGSTRRWISETGMGATWSLEVVGNKAVSTQCINGASVPLVNNLSSLIKRKRPESTEKTPAEVNLLGAGLVRKKVKT